VPLHPSIALTQIAGALHTLECADDDGSVAEWLERTSDTLAGELGAYAVEEWTYEATAMMSLPAIRAVRAWPPEKPENEHEFYCLVKALQCLDRWHRPLSAQSDRTTYPMLEDHETVYNNLFRGRLLAEDERGGLIPAAALARGGKGSIERPDHALLVDDPMVEGPGMGSRPALLRHLLAETVYLPSQLAVENPDIPKSMEGRHVRMSYVRPPQDLQTLPPPDEAKPLRIGIAPLPQRAGDSRLEVMPCKSRYGVRPTYDTARLDEVLMMATEREVELLLFPEMSIAEEHLAHLSRAILNAARGSPGDLPTLRYVFAGVWGARRSESSHCRNFMVVLSATGTEIFRQNKLHHWNLKEDDLTRYGFAQEFTGLATRLYEDIEPASEVFVADLEHLGRLVTLICADADFNTPGDWMITHLNVDWLHMPIMDHTTVVWGRNGKRTWISKRAQRAAYAGHSRVIVTNSVALTHRMNAENRRNGSSDRCFSECGIGFLIDATTEDPTYSHIAIPMEEADGPTILRCVEWKCGWDRLPQAPPE
jgi:hypothetical protein